ncbi:co-chaperone GroES [Limnochorda pilosa]|uniref:Co-chaperonin GroES n=1 Tax=Limnochorda pilosa TaxID=1555112 RepID=A0A0K2SGH4_LIMPI|nr:co-chaperone GroES [Limnochorda pilosa]BAS25949.1 molecular chaperone GroES [Limnochorda pilosa]
MEIQPLEDRVLIRLVKPEEKSPGGIFLPDVAQEKSAQAEVIAIGTSDEEWPFKAGDRVLVDKYSGTEIRLNGETYTILQRQDVLARIKA